MSRLLQAEVDPSEVGMDAHRLARLHTHFTRYVNDGRLAGWQPAVSRGGVVAHVASCGHGDREARLSVADDTVWRIYSMTKPITTGAALMLWEEGRFELKDPVLRFLPAFGDVQVWAGGNAERPELVRQRRDRRRCSVGVAAS